ncbi:MAG: nucleoside phosphorylase [Promethearchaeota archaeon]
MFKNASDKVKEMMINAAIKFLKPKDRMAQIFLSTMSSNINPIVVLPATHSVGKKIHSRMKNVEKKGFVYSGSLNNVKISLIRTQVGTPSTSTIMETLALIKPKAIIRLDYAGSLMDNIKVGDVFIASAAIPGDGTSIHYIHGNQEAFRDMKTSPEKQGDNKSINCPDPVYSWLLENNFTGKIGASPKFIEILKDMKSRIPALENGFKIHFGTTWTTDGLFMETKEKINFWKKQGATSVDMETSCIYLLAKLHGIPAIAIHGISDNALEGKKIQEQEHFNIGVEKGIDRAIEILEKLLECI